MRNGVGLVEAELLSTGEVAKMLGIAQTTVYHFITNGFLVPDKVNPAQSSGKCGKRWFKQETVDAFLESCMTTKYNGERLLSSGEVAQYFGVSTATVRYWVSHDLLKPDLTFPMPNGGTGARRFKQSTVIYFAEQRQLKHGDFGDIKLRKCNRQPLSLDKMLGVGKVAQALYVHRDTVHNYVARGLLKPDAVAPPMASGHSGRLLFKPETVDTFIDSCVVGEYDGGRLYSSAEIANRVGISQSAVNRYVETGVLRPDVELPLTRRGIAAMRKFSQKTVDEFEARFSSRGGS